MPIYEYYCDDCETKFDVLRTMSQADDPIACVQCEGMNTHRALSLFAAVSKGGSGETRSVAGTGGGCSSCGATSCATCGH